MMFPPTICFTIYFYYLFLHNKTNIEFQSYFPANSARSVPW